MNNNNNYIEQIQNSPWYESGKRFLFDWLREIAKESKKPTAKQVRGRPYTRTIRKWIKDGTSEQWVSDSARVARNIMNELVKRTHPEIKSYL